MGLKKDLTFFNLTNITIGSIVGADIYVVAGIVAGLIGPFALVVWIVAGIMAMSLALVLAYCSYYDPHVGGPFAFVSTAFDNFYGVLAGWSLWIAELLALPIYAIALVLYLHYFVHLDFLQEVLVKGIFLFGLTYVNIRGMKAAGKLNDVLTIAKLSPLFLIVGIGLLYIILHPSTLMQNYSPLIPVGIGNFAPAFILIF